MKTDTGGCAVIMFAILCVRTSAASAAQAILSVGDAQEAGLRLVCSLRNQWRWSRLPTRKAGPCWRIDRGLSPEAAEPALVRSRLYHEHAVLDTGASDRRLGQSRTQGTAGFG